MADMDLAKITEIHELLKSDEPLAGMKRMSDIRIEGNFVDAETDTYTGADAIGDLFDTARIGQVLNIVTHTRTLKFELVQINIP